MSLMVELPERPVEISSPRVWNKINRDAMLFALAYHHRKHMPRHFDRDARSRYRYTPRQPGYVRSKQKRFKKGGLDLVFTGATRDSIVKPAGWKSRRIGGTAVGGNLKGTLEYRFSFADKLREHFARKFAAPAGLDARQKRKFLNRKRDAVKEQQKARGKVRVTIEHMRRELMAMTTEEVAAIAEVYRKEVFRGIAAVPQKRKRLKKQLTFSAFRAA